MKNFFSINFSLFSIVKNIIMEKVRGIRNDWKDDLVRGIIRGKYEKERNDC